MNYQVNDIFLSVQGEGFHAGMPMCFIRLAGCNLDCPWCDTDHKPAYALTEHEILDQVSERLEKTSVELVCITGGEPTVQDLGPLVEILREYYLVHLETNGTRKLCESETPDWITVSPKFPPGLGKIKQVKGDELKLAVWPELTDDQISTCAVFGDYPHRYLQPVDGLGFKKSVKRSLEVAYESGAWRISFQGHKRLRVP